MILHTINKHSPPAQLPVVTHVVPSRTAARYDKLGYATYLSTVPFVKGSLIRNKFLDVDVIPATAVFTVIDIQEIHYMCEQGEKEPKCILIQNSEGTKFWTEPWRWIEVTQPIEYIGVEC